MASQLWSWFDWSTTTSSDSSYGSTEKLMGPMSSLSPPCFASFFAQFAHCHCHNYVLLCVKATIRLSLSLPSQKKVDKIYPRRDSILGPRPQSKVFDALDHLAMIPLRSSKYFLLSLHKSLKLQSWRNVHKFNKNMS